MSFSRAVVFLWASSLRNRLVRQLQRLKHPRYLLGALVALAYLYTLVGRTLWLRGGSSGGPPQGVRLFAELSLVLSVLGTVFTAWVLGTDRPSLSFTETEVQQLFPAPVTRRALLHYKLMRGLLGAGVGALAATLFVGRIVSPSPLRFFVGASLALGTLFLHGTAASFVRARLAARGAWGPVVRWGVVGVVLGAVVLAGVVALRNHPFPEQVSSPRELRTWLMALLDEPGPRAVLWPGRLMVAPALSRSVEDFLRALPPVLGVMAAHYVWVVAAEVPFEEAAVVRAEARTRDRALRAASRGARAGAIRVTRQPFTLKARGRPEVALLWKNLIARRRFGGGWVALLAFGVMGAAMAAAVGDARALVDLRRLAGPVCLTMAAVMAVMGPSAFRMDLRMDLPKLEMLRALPLTGRQVVGAELAASALALGGFQVVLVLAALVLGAGEELGLDPWWVPGVAALVPLLPAISLAGLFVQNAAVVLLPAWVPTDVERARGIEAFGQRLLTLAGTVVVTLVGLLPAAFVALVVGYPLSEWLGLWALPVAGLTAAGVLVTEVLLGVMALGKAFEELDVSEDGAR